MTRRRRLQPQPARDVRPRAAERDLSRRRRASWISSRGCQSQLRQLPGVQGVAPMHGLPPQRQVNANDTDFEGYTAPPEGPFENIDYYQTVTPDYLTTMGIPVRRRPRLRAADVGGPPVVARQRDAGEDVLPRPDAGRPAAEARVRAQGAVVHDRRRRPRRQAGRRRAEDRHRALLPRRPGAAARQLRAAQHEHRGALGAAVRVAGRRRPPRRRGRWIRRCRSSSCGRWTRCSRRRSRGRASSRSCSDIPPAWRSRWPRSAPTASWRTR